MSNNVEDLQNRFESKIKLGQKMLSSLEATNIEGIPKLKKKIRQELLFLNKVLTSNVMKNEHLLSTNLHHFEALVSCIFESLNVVSVLESKSYKSNDGETKKLCIDIVCDNGRKWIKVIARNPKALSQILSGEGEYGQKSIVDHAIDYIECAKHNQYMFKEPMVYFYFASGVTTALRDSLKKVNVNILGYDIEDTHDDDSVAVKSCNEKQLVNDSNHLCADNDAVTCNYTNEYATDSIDLQVINLDVSSMIAFVSALTNNGSHSVFKEPLLNQQADWERSRPVKPILENLFRGKRLICCETAYESFKDIVKIIGGPEEKKRTEDLISMVSIVPDVPYDKLKLGGRVKQRSLIIFGTGYHNKALTVTANEGFVRAAKQQGIDFAVFVHESRALTEIKQNRNIQSIGLK